MSLTTTPLTTATSTMAEIESAETQPAARPVIGATSRGKLLLKLLPLAGLGWAWLFQVAELQSSATAALGLGTWTGFVLLSTLLVAAASDMATHRIPNALTYPAFAWIVGLGIVRETIAHFGTEVVAGVETLSPTAARWVALIGGPSLTEQLAGALVCFAIMFFMFLFSGTGGGDVKLAAFIGAAVGLYTGAAAIVATYIVGGCYGLCWSIAKFGPVRVCVGLLRCLGTLLVPMWVAPPSEADRGFLKAPMPMGAAFVVGTLFAIYQFAAGLTF